MPERCLSACENYQRFFVLYLAIRYTGEGRGLEGKAIGKADISAPVGIFRFFESLDLNSFSNRYAWDGIEVFPNPDAPFDSLILIGSPLSEKCILFDHGAVPPIFRVITDMLDLLIDTAEWNKHGFFLQRDLSVKPSVKRKWG